METGVHIVVKGMVQGVGFRYFVRDRASRLGLNGIVQNKYDGSVTIDVEGDRSLIEELIKDVKTGPRFADVTDMLVEWKCFENRYHSFDIY